MANLPVQSLEAQASEIEQLFNAHPDIEQQLAGPEDQDELEEAERWIAQLAEDAHEAAINTASSDIENELVGSINLDNDRRPLENVDLIPIGLSEYVATHQKNLDEARGPEERQQMAAQVLTGYLDPTMTQQYHISPPAEGQIASRDMAFSLDIDSVMASFQATDSWPFIMEAEVQLYAVGPFDRRQIGTSKFRIDPSDEQGANTPNWAYRVRLFHN